MTSHDIRIPLKFLHKYDEVFALGNQTEEHDQNFRKDDLLLMWWKSFPIISRLAQKVSGDPSIYSSFRKGIFNCQKIYCTRKDGD